MERLILSSEAENQNQIIEQQIDSDELARLAAIEKELKARQLAEMESPARVAGDLVLGAVMGGAIAHSILATHAEVAREVVSSSADYADRAVTR